MKAKIIFLGLLFFVLACKLDNIHEDLEIVNTAAPEAEFQVVNNNCEVPCDIDFINNSRNATIFQWRFGDGATSTEREPTHQYTASGSYPVKLIASNANNQVDSITNVVMVQDLNCIAIANFEIDIVPDCKAPCEVTFTNTSLNSTEFTWNFGNGTSTEVGSFTRIFDKPGDYNIVLTASDGTCQTSITKSISVDWLTFTRTFGGSSSESGVAVKQTEDGGYILVGNRLGGGLFAYNLIKVNKTGIEEWSKTYERFAGNVRETSNGDLVIAAEQLSGSGYLKTDPFGNINGGATWEGDATFDALQISSQTHLSLGTKDDGGNDDIYLVEYNQIGATISIGNYFYGGSGNDIGQSFQQTSDGGFIITGSTTSEGAGGEDVYLLKINSDFELEWSTPFGTPGRDLGEEIQITNDGGFIIIGTTNYEFASENQDIYVVKTTSSGQEEWTQTYSQTRKGRSIYPTDDGGYIITGDDYRAGLGYEVLLIKISSDGTEEWRQTYGGNDSDQGASVVQTTDGGFAILGSTSSEGAGLSDMYFIKTDNLGNIE